MERYIIIIVYVKRTRQLVHKFLNISSMMFFHTPYKKFHENIVQFYIKNLLTFKTPRETSAILY